jgi:HEAT repeat protein
MGSAIEPALAALKEAARDRADSLLREYAAHALSQAGHRAQSDDILIDLAKSDPDRYVRQEAVHALERMGAAHAGHVVPALEQVVRSDAESSVRAAAVRALGQMGAAAVPVLLQALRDKDSVVRWHAVNTLGALAPPPISALPALREALRDESSLVADAAKRVVEKLESGS